MMPGKNDMRNAYLAQRNAQKKKPSLQKLKSQQMMADKAPNMMKPGLKAKGPGVKKQGILKRIAPGMKRRPM